VRFWHVFSQGVSHSLATVASGSNRLVQPPHHLTHRNRHSAKTRQEIAKWMEKELKIKLGEGTYGSAQKFHIWEFAAASATRPAMGEG